MNDVRLNQRNLVKCLNPVDGGDTLYMRNGVNPYHFVDKGTLTKHVESLFNERYYFNTSIIADVTDAAKISELTTEKVSEIYRVDGWNNYGLIIRPKPIQIKVAWYDDVSTPTNQRKFGKWVKENEGKILDPYQVIARSMHLFNHLVLNGHADMDIEGVDYFPSSDKHKMVEHIDALLGVLDVMYPARAFPVVEVRRRYAGWYTNDKSVDPLESRDEFESFGKSSSQINVA